MSDYYAKGTVQAIKEAWGDRRDLVPFVGSGMATPLGLPTWLDLVRALAEGTDVDVSAAKVLEPANVLQSIHNALRRTGFVRRVQDLLRTPENCTSVALLGLARCRVRRIVTTNLDFSIETAFKAAGQPLSAYNVFVGSGREDLAVTLPGESGTQLFKIHGSLESPDKWVLTREQYDTAYGPGSALRDFLMHSVGIPLFMGFGFNDFDIGQSLRMAELTGRRRAYTLLHINSAPDLDERVRNQGVIPIYFFSYDQIPEILDDIFELEPLEVREIKSVSSGTGRHSEPKVTGLHVGGIKLSFSPSFPADRLEEVGAIVANAIEGRPERSLPTGVTRRQWGGKGDFKKSLIALLKGNEKTEFAHAALRAFRQCPEVLLDGVIPAILRNDELEHYDLIKAVWPVEPELPLDSKLQALLLDSLGCNKISFGARRAIAKVMGERRLHPGQAMPPSCVRVGQLLVSIYPLTRFQVGLLIGDEELKREHSVRPYTIRAFEETHRIINRLREETLQPWRLPTRDEWLQAAGRSPADPVNPRTEWPWGSETPKAFGAHAHLQFDNENKFVRAAHPLEVGVFSSGRSTSGIYDLVGNVYEVVIAPDNEFRLAGGSYTTNYRGSAPEGFKWISYRSTGSGNVGLRPVMDAQVPGQE